MADDEKKEMAKRLIKFVSEKWNDKPCPMCGHPQWSVDEDIFELRKFHGGGLVVGNETILPVAPVICVNCGYTILVNAVRVGVIKKKPIKEGEENG